MQREANVLKHMNSFAAFWGFSCNKKVFLQIVLFAWGMAFLLILTVGTAYAQNYTGDPSQPNPGNIIDIPLSQTWTGTTFGRGNSTVNPANGFDNWTITVEGVIDIGNAPAISLRNNASITVTGTVQNNAINHGGYFGTGANTIEVRSSSTIIVGVANSNDPTSGYVISNGTEGQAEAINVHGFGNTSLTMVPSMPSITPPFGFRTVWTWIC